MDNNMKRKVFPVLFILIVILIAIASILGIKYYGQDEQSLSQGLIVLKGSRHHPPEVRSREEMKTWRFFPLDDHGPFWPDEVGQNLHDPGWAEYGVGNPTALEKILSAQLHIHHIEPTVLLPIRGAGHIRNPPQLLGASVSGQAN